MTAVREATDAPRRGPAAGGSAAGGDVFAKAFAYTRPDDLRAVGLYPYFLAIEDSEATEVVIAGRRRVMLGSNNHLGLTHDPRVIAAATEALARYGAGCTGSRFLNGNTVLHDRLEGELAALTGKPAALVFPTGYQTNVGVIAAGLVALRDRHGARLVVDDAHALGVLGPTGAGTAEHFGLTDQVDLIVGTFSKSLGAIGGFVAGDAAVIRYLRHHARSLMFSAALPPAASAAVLAALDILRAEPERRAALWRNARRLRDGLAALGFDVGGSATPIVPVITGAPQRTFEVWRALFDAGVFTNPVVPPAVPDGACRIRTSAMATHTDAQLDQVLDAFAAVARATGVARGTQEGRVEASVSASARS